MKILRVVGIVFIVLAVAFLIIFILGAMQPRAHTATVAATIDAPQIVVWQRIEDVAEQPSWRTGLTAVQPLPSQNGHTCWMEIQSHGKMPLCEIVAAAPATRIVAIADTKLPFGGTWTYELTPIDANHTRLSITENGTTGPALWRFAGHYIYHEDTTIKQYESDLQKSVGKP
jgi:hypothetical protein